MRGRKAKKDRHVAGCVQQLQHPDEKARLTAAQAMEFFIQQADDEAAAMRQAAPALAAALRDDSPRVRQAVARTLAWLAADFKELPWDVIPALIAARADDNPHVVTWAGAALKKLGHP